MHQQASYQRELECEKRARQQAEEMLEKKSLEFARIHEDLANAVAALREANHDRAVLEIAADGVITFDERGVIESFNATAETIFGCFSELAIGAGIDTFVPGIAQLETKCNADDLPLDGGYVESSGEMLGKRLNGDPIPLEVNVRHVQLPDRVICAATVRDLTDRKRMERQLVHAQKMESVGQLGAGIAHEINTPIQYVSDNLHFLDESFAELMPLVRACRKMVTDGMNEASVAQLTESLKRADLDFLLDEIPNAIAQSLEGAERVSGIVLAMKEFAQPSTASKVAIDVHAAIESTITVSRNEWKYVAEVVRDFDPHLVHVPCHPGDFNQSILNLVVNAAQAIKDKGGDAIGTITIATRMDGTWAEILIRDSGIGIPEEIRDRIFDPFFTTKPVGVGTGQGLAITYAMIVERHGGTLAVESEMGIGTTFIIRLPTAVATMVDRGNWNGNPRLVG